MLGFKTYIAEAKATPCGRCGTTHVAPKDGGKCPAVEGTNSADKKPENYVDQDGKTKTRMVPAKRDIVKTEEKDPCWDTHKQVGMKKKNGKEVPNCVPKEAYKDMTDAERDAFAKKIGDDQRARERSKKVSSMGAYKGRKVRKEETELQEYGVMSKSAFKRKEHEFEAEREREASAKRAKTQSEPHHLYINKKVWKKNGKPVEFANKRHANSAGLSILKKDPKKDVRITHHSYHAKNGDNLK